MLEGGERGSQLDQVRFKADNETDPGFIGIFKALSDANQPGRLVWLGQDISGICTYLGEF